MAKRNAIILITLCLLFIYGIFNTANAEIWTYEIPLKLLQSDLNTLINRDNLLKSDDEPVDLVEINFSRASSVPILARAIVADACKELFEAAQKDGLKLYVKSGYRAYETQNTMYKNRLQSNDGKDDGIVQYPGASEHQSGLALDIVNKEYATGKKMNYAFGNTKEGQWIAENCTNFGFIIRYPEGKENITNIYYEPWHIRYVGNKIAKYITDNELTHEEFTNEWKASLNKFLSSGGKVEQAIAQGSDDDSTRIIETRLETGDTEVSIQIND